MPKIAIVQQSMSGDFAENVEKSLSLIAEAASGGADLVSFPEVQFSPFFPQYEKRDASPYLIDIGHEAITRMQALCRDLGVVATPNFYLSEGGKRFDASLVIDKTGDILSISKMVHIVQMPLFYEQDYYTQSDGGFEVVDTAFGRVGVVICFDRHFPESFRSAALQGAELVVVPTANLKGERLEVFEWEMRIAAMQNSIYIALCNRVGVEGEVVFAGHSVFVDPNGEVVARAGEEDKILYADYSPDFQREAKAARGWMDLRRPEAYFPEG